MFGKIVSVTGISRLIYVIQPGRFDADTFTPDGEAVGGVFEVNNRRFEVGRKVFVFQEDDGTKFFDGM